MNVAIRAILVSVLLIPLGASTASAQSSAAQSHNASNRPKPVPVGDHVSLVGGEDVLPWLVIDYPWTKHEDVSLEVRLVSGVADAAAGRTGPGKVHPMRFRANWMHGERLSVLTERLNWINQRNLPRIPVAERITEPELIAWRNNLRRRAVGVIEHFGRGETVAGGRAIPGVAISLPWLRQWSIGDRRLVIDLPTAEFSDRGWIRVWLLRGGTPLWQQDLPWAGAPNQEETNKDAK